MRKMLRKGLKEFRTIKKNTVIFAKGLYKQTSGVAKGFGKKIAKIDFKGYYATATAGVDTLYKGTETLAVKGAKASAKEIAGFIKSAALRRIRKNALKKYSAAVKFVNKTYPKAIMAAEGVIAANYPKAKKLANTAYTKAQKWTKATAPKVRSWVETKYPVAQQWVLNQLPKIEDALVKNVGVRLAEAAVKL